MSFNDALNTLFGEAKPEPQPSPLMQGRAIENAMQSMAVVYHVLTIADERDTRYRGRVFFVDAQGVKFRVQIQQV